MKTKTWKKAVLFSLVTSWSVFTTGCISPAIFKAILGLVEAIFNDTTGTPGAKPAATGTGANLNTANQGGNGLVRNADGSVRVGTPDAGTQPTVPNRQAGAGLAADAVDTANAAANPPPSAGGGGPTDQTRAGAATLRDQVSILLDVTAAGLDFLKSAIPNCDAVGGRKADQIAGMGAVNGAAVALDARIGTLLTGNLNAAQQAAELTEVQARLDGLQTTLIGNGLAQNLRLPDSKTMFRQAFANMKAGTPDAPTGSQYVAADSFIGQCWQLHEQAKRECPSAQ